MIKRFIVAVSLILPCLVWGQSSLPRCLETGVKHDCFGTITSANGEKYVGEFRDDKFHGQGTYTWSDGRKYVGVFRDGKAHGQGTATFANRTFVGEFRDGKAHGQGTVTFADGRKYVGEYRDDKRDGQGIEYRADGTVVKSGRWEAGNLASQYLIDPSRFPFGPLLLSDSKLTTSSRESDSSGRVCSANQRYTTWSDCVGVFNFRDGARFVGLFKEGQFFGPGILYDARGSVLQMGQWRYGSLVKAEFIDKNLYSYQIASSQEQARLVGKEESELKRLQELEAKRVVELEDERKRRQELEERLATETKERERLAAEAKERERLLAEAKERERQQAQTPLPQPQAAIRNERRVALLVGNGAYKQSPLTNSVNDAVDLNVSLKNLGFQTLLVQNASLTTMRQKTREFAELALNADVALIFFSGHGIEYRGNNYLIPTSAGSLKEFEVEDETFNVARWMDMLETQKGANKQRVNIVILDACRDNAFSRGWRNTNRGLARMDAPSGTILAYATAPGKLASDGSAGERNSPYTKNLLKAIQQPNVPVEQVFKDVRRMVVEQTKGEQVPWENSSLIGNFVFKR